jgi:hypothetical protein
MSSDVKATVVPFERWDLVCSATVKSMAVRDELQERRIEGIFVKT